MQYEIVTAFTPEFRRKDDAELAALLLIDEDVDCFQILDPMSPGFNQFGIWVELANAPAQWERVGTAVAKVFGMFSEDAMM
jgi:hypothetical protein